MARKSYALAGGSLMWLTTMIAGNPAYAALLSNDFESASPLSGWTVQDGGTTKPDNKISVSTDVAKDGAHSLKFQDGITDDGSGSWWPQTFKAWTDLPSKTKALTLSYDAYMTDSVSSAVGGLKLALRGSGNTEGLVVTILGNKIGYIASSGFTELALNFTLSSAQWMHIDISAEAPSGVAANDTFTLVVSQGANSQTFENLPFKGSVSQWADVLFSFAYASQFAQNSSGQEVFAYVDNLNLDLTPVPETASLGLLGCAGAALLNKRARK